MKKLAILVAAGLIALPATAFALTSSPASPLTVSISGTGHPQCTTLSYTTTAKLDYRSMIHFNNAEQSILTDSVMAGRHSISWCASPTAARHHQVGPIGWWVTTVHFRGDTPGQPSVTRTFNVVA